MGKERTSVVSTPSLADLLVRKSKRKRNRDGRKKGKWREKVKARTAHMDDYVDGRESARLKLEPNVSMGERAREDETTRAGHARSQWKYLWVFAL